MLRHKPIPRNGHASKLSERSFAARDRALHALWDTEFGRTKKVVAETSIGDEIRAIGIRRTMALTKMSQHTIEKLIRGEAVKRKTHEHMLKAIRGLRIDDQNGGVVQ